LRFEGDKDRLQFLLSLALAGQEKGKEIENGKRQTTNRTTLKMSDMDNMYISLSIMGTGLDT